MPTEVKAYSCDFGCGKRVLKSKHGMKQHEKVCFKNPANRACQTCAFDNGHEYILEKKHYLTHCGFLGPTKTTSDCRHWRPSVSVRLVGKPDNESA